MYAMPDELATLLCNLEEPTPCKYKTMDQIHDYIHKLTQSKVHTPKLIHLHPNDYMYRRLYRIFRTLPTQLVILYMRMTDYITFGAIYKMFKYPKLEVNVLYWDREPDPCLYLKHINLQEIPVDTVNTTYKIAYYLAKNIISQCDINLITNIWLCDDTINKENNIKLLQLVIHTFVGDKSLSSILETLNKINDIVAPMQKKT